MAWPQQDWHPSMPGYRKKQYKQNIQCKKGFLKVLSDSFSNTLIPQFLPRNAPRTPEKIKTSRSLRASRFDF
jgi:hypothetical protein